MGFIDIYPFKQHFTNSSLRERILQRVVLRHLCYNICDVDTIAVTKSMQPNQPHTYS